MTDPETLDPEHAHRPIIASTCAHCRQAIYANYDGANCLDWETADHDYGCDDAPATDADAVDGHQPYDPAARLWQDQAAAAWARGDRGRAYVAAVDTAAMQLGLI